MGKRSRKLLAWLGRLALATAGSTAACSPGVLGDMQGRWLGQGVESMPDEQVASATGWAKGMSLELTDSHITVTVPSETPRSAPYEVASVKENDVRLEVKRPDGKKDYLELTLNDERQLRWHVGSGMSVLLAKEE